MNLLSRMHTAQSITVHYIPIEMFKSQDDPYPYIRRLYKTLTKQRNEITWNSRD